MAFLVKISTFISRLCQFLGGVSLIIIVLTTMLDVTNSLYIQAHWWWVWITVKGSVEIVSYFMLFSLLAAFAAFVERSQIIVDVFTQKMPQAVKGYMMGIFMMGFFVIGIVFAWGLYESAFDAISTAKSPKTFEYPWCPSMQLVHF